MTAPADSHTPRQRLVFAALTTIIIIAAVAAALLPGFRQKALVDEIEAHGGLISIESAFPEWLDRALTHVVGHRHNRMFGQMKWVIVVGDWFDDRRMAQANRFQGAETVILSDTAITADGLSRLVQNSALRSLGFHKTSAGSPTLRDLPAIPDLELLMITMTGPMDGSRLAARFPKLERLSLIQCDVTAADLREIRALRSLSVLLVEHSNVDDAGFSHLALHPRLERVQVKRSSFGDAGLAHIATCANLTWLDLSETSISDVGVTRLAQTKSLEDLELSGTNVTSRGVQALAELPKLRYLGLERTRVTDDVVPVLKSMPIEYVDIRGTTLSAQAADRLQSTIRSVRR
ncbi:MAG: hypothetical protein WED34_09900 [Planctomycetales bacterium]